MPSGVRAPRHVRIYQRSDQFILQWWDKQEKRTLSERVDGDLVTAIVRAREIDERLQHFKSSGRKSCRFGHTAVVDNFLADLRRRADAGEIDVDSVNRYASALRRHFLKFVGQPSVSRRYRHVGDIDRSFQIEFAAYLSNVQVSPNGHPNARSRPLKHPAFVMDVVRAMLEWAADPDRGNLLPDGFRNPFSKRRQCRQVVQDPVDDLDITMAMAAELISICDVFQLRVFAPLLLYGLRPGELGWLFHEHLSEGWLRVACIAELDYTTKGRRDKRFPLVTSLKSIWQDPKITSGLVYRNRRVYEGRRTAHLQGKGLQEFSMEFEQRCVQVRVNSAVRKRHIRNTLMKDAGQLNYDHVEGEFSRLTRILGWPRCATLKDLRHLFSTSLENAGVPEYFRRYFMGHSLGRAPIATYTHLSGDMLRQHYQKALDSELAPIVDAIDARYCELHTTAAKEAKNVQQ